MEQFNLNEETESISAQYRQEKEQPLPGFNQTPAPYPDGMTMAGLFEAQAARTPDHIGVAAGELQLSYSQLNAAANRIAALLTVKNVKPGSVVGIMGKRSTWTIAGILGILKAGCAYLPIDANDPVERINYILKDSRACALITGEYLKNRYHSLSTIRTLKHIVLIEDLTREQTESRNPEPAAEPGDLIYIIYASGITGTPKGVRVTHRNAVNYINWAAKTYAGNRPVNFPLYGSIAFDSTVTSIFTPLITGNTVVVYQGEAHDILIEEVIKESRVDAVKLTPSHLKLVNDYRLDGKLSRIKCFILGGEALDARLASEVYDNFNGTVAIYNEYGPRETTVGSMMHPFDPEADRRMPVPIGKPIDNTRIYLLDKSGEPVPVEAIGEIYISGAGVSEGYLHNPGLTRERFLPNPFEPGKIMYRTGDMARSLEDGNLEFCGRLDRQVKIRGYRVETGEVENNLTSHKGITRAAVVLKTDETGDNYLCAYFTAQRELSSVQLREYMSRRLPEYMVPSFFVLLETFPLTSNGQLDKNALPEPQVGLGGQYIAPRCKTEQELVRIWSGVLSIAEPDLSTTVNFFEVGGQSLKATAMAAEIRKAFAIKVPLSTLFEIPTIIQMAEYLDNAGKEISRTIEPVEHREHYPLSSAQERLYRLHRMNKNHTAYNVTVGRMLEGKLDIVKLDFVFRELLWRHEGLRTTFDSVDNEVVQEVHALHALEFKIEHYNMDSSVNDQQSIDAIINHFIQPFDLSRPPLLRVGLIALEPGKYILLADMHHIVTDRFSTDVFVTDFISMYSGNEDRLTTLKIQYKDFALWQNREKETETLKNQESYWLNEFSGELPSLNLPTDYSRPSVQRFDGESIYFDIGVEEAGGLNRLANGENATLFMVLLTLFYILLSKLSGQEEVVIGTPVAGRRHEDLEQIMGMFVNTLALRLKPVQARTFREFLGEVKGKTLEAFENQDYQFEDIFGKVALDRDMSRNPVFDVMFILQHVDMAEVQLPGLTLKPYRIKCKTAKFDLCFTAGEIGDSLRVIVEYSTRLFKPETVERFIYNFKNIVTAVIGDPDQALAGVKRFPEENRWAFLDESADDELENE
ncbi:MAG: amino acid adenylation domain-containing protein [bacterium]|nr:amino acid adenylation domain-containing protein [bacterium]